MIEQVEIGSLDLRCERLRMRNESAARRMLPSIEQRGIEEPLEGVETSGCRVLLDGFKRLWCARRLQQTLAPWRSLGQDMAMGITRLMKISNDKSLTILEQAGFVEELHRRHEMTQADIARDLSRSKAWVCMRIGMMAQMSERIRGILFRGEFPAYAYMQIVRPFMRINGVSPALVESFVAAVAGRGLSVRQIETLAHAFFNGPPSLREQIEAGHLDFALERARRSAPDAPGCSEFENQMLREMGWVQNHMRKIILKSRDRRLKSASFRAQAELLSGGLLACGEEFLKAARAIHDRCGQA
jgi:hypothetical protein